LEGAQVTEEGASSSASQTLAADVISGGRARTAGGSQSELGHKAATGSHQVAAEEEIRDKVTITMPADGAYLSVLRTATAGLAARLDFTLDEIEDMRIAVDEACAMLLSQAVPGTSLDCTFTLGRDQMTIAVSVLSQAARPPASDSFAWTVLSALAGSVEARVGPGSRLAIVLQKSRELSGSV
jgi:serine/threonine-protein kinase RsbW